MKDDLAVRQYLKNCGIQDILDLQNLTEIAINKPNEIFFDRGKGWESLVDKRASYSNLYSLAIALSVFSKCEKLQEINPIASVTLPDGERGQILIDPAAEKGCIYFTIRKPSHTRFTLNDYQKTGRLDEFKKNLASTHKNKINQKLIDLYESGDMQSFFELAVKSNKNILLVGATGSGKTTVMKAFSDLYPSEQRILTIEDVHELDLPNHPNHAHMFYKHGSKVTPKLLIESAMRMKPDHVLLAELRGDEAWSYLELLNTGHEGSITTVHANNCEDAFKRITSLVKQSPFGSGLDYDFILKIVQDSLDIICFFKNTKLAEIKLNLKGVA
ncbi:MAG: P-type DNA transfer ATPase VirB11 [Psittacicella sp.]